MRNYIRCGILAYCREHVENAKGIEFDLPEAQQKLADCEPRFISTYIESDGSTHSSTGSLFDC